MNPLFVRFLKIGLTIDAVLLLIVLLSCSDGFFGRSCGTAGALAEVLLAVVNFPLSGGFAFIFVVHGWSFTKLLFMALIGTAFNAAVIAGGIMVARRFLKGGTTSADEDA